MRFDNWINGRMCFSLPRYKIEKCALMIEQMAECDIFQSGYLLNATNSLMMVAEN